MGGICERRNATENENFNNYHCKKCGEIPLIHFSIYDFNIICSYHKILNIPIDQFYNYISLDYKCLICKKMSKSNNLIYCYECDDFFCKQCINRHNMKNSHFTTNNIIEKNTICKLHNKNYNKYCLKCGLNLCELCENSYNHYTELFSDIYPLDDDIKSFKNIAVQILKNNLEENELFDNQENDEVISNNKLENEVVNMKILFVNYYSKNISNYNYISNINKIIKCTVIKKTIIKNLKNEIKFIRNNIPKYDINNIENKILIKSISKQITNDYNSQTFCIKKLNVIKIDSLKKLELISIGGSNHKILLLNILNFNIYQIIDEHKSTVYSLEQFEDNPNYLFSSSGDSTINIYQLYNNYKYKLIQKLKKSEEKRVGEINKIIMLSNKLLVSGDHTAITIWKSDNKNRKELYYEYIHEIIINRDTCNLLEVNKNAFVAMQYSHGGYFQVYKNDDKAFPLLGELVNIQSHGNSSNGLAKINDKLICSVSDNNFFYIICIEPIEIIQKIKIYSEKYTTIFYLYVTKDNYLYCKGEYQSIIQYKIIKDEDDNFIELKQIGIYNKGIHFSSYEKAILPFDDGRIFFVDEKEGQICYNLIT